MRVLSSMATKALLGDLLSDPAVVRDVEVTLEPGGGVVVADRIRGGEAADLAVLASGAMRKLLREGAVREPIVPLFVSEVVLAITDDAERPRLETEDDLREILLGAERIGYSTGPSGDALLALLDRWGVRDHLAVRLLQAPAGTPVGQLLARGEVTVGVQQRSEFTGVEGVLVVGALPPGCEVTTVFAGAVISASEDAEGARRILTALAGRDAAETISRHGMTPA